MPWENNLCMLNHLLRLLCVDSFLKMMCMLVLAMVVGLMSKTQRIISSSINQHAGSQLVRRSVMSCHFAVLTKGKGFKIILMFMGNALEERL